MVHILNVKPDINVLKQRLSKSLMRDGRKTKKISMTLDDLIQKLQDLGETLNQAVIEEQMRDYLTPEELPGLEKKMRIGLKMLEELLV